MLSEAVNFYTRSSDEENIGADDGAFAENSEDVLFDSAMFNPIQGFFAHHLLHLLCQHFYDVINMNYNLHKQQHV